MGYGLYNGDSAGVEMLTDGYIDYSFEVIARRAFPDLRDGLKPVGRRILYAIKTKVKGEGLSKCGTLVGRVMELHPHGDSSVYGALCTMTDINGTYNIPMFNGQGEFGRVYSKDKPAAMRYTKAKLSKYADDFFTDSVAMKLVPSEEGEGEEPIVLPVKIPMVLINGTNGMAVSVATNIPSFNTNEVLNLTIKGIQKGFDKLDVTDIIAPDFPTGGILVKDDGELAKIMRVGKGKLKVRAKVEIEGKNIIVKEVPVDRTVEGIIKSITDEDIYGVSEVRDITGFKSNGLINIQCKSKKVTEDVILKLYQTNILQNIYTSNINVIEDGKPYMLGVFEILERWVAWRRKIVEKKININYDSIRAEMTTLSYFIRLISNNEWRDKYVDLAVHKNRKEASDYLVEIFKDIPDETCTWINGRALSAFNNGGRYLTRYNELEALGKQYDAWLADIDSYIVAELKDYMQTKGRDFPRKTELTYKDYRFSVSREEEAEDTSFCYYYLRNDNFIFKTRNVMSEENIVCKFSGAANSLIIGFDNFGRIIRIPGLEIPYGNEGLYIPKFVEAPDDPNHVYKILYMTNCDGKKVYLMYRDGYIGMIDTADFIGKKRSKILSNGVPLAVHDSLLDIIEEKDFPKFILLASDSGKHIKMGIVNTEDINWKSRSSRNKVLSGTTGFDIQYYSTCNDPLEILKTLSNAENYMGKLSMFRPEDLIIRTSDMMNFTKGKYVA
jgi:DNA gyrase subunit A